MVARRHSGGNWWFVGLRDEKGGYPSDLHDYPTIVIRFQCGDYEIVVVEKGAFDPVCLACGDLSMTSR